ncbi:MAG: UbiA family prenyltransferase [Bacteroidota bacterium]
MIKKTLKLLIYTNIFVSLGAFLLACETIFFLNLNFSEYLQPLVLVFFATLFLYNYQRVIAFKNKANHLQSQRHIWIDNHQKLLISITITAALISLIIGISIANKFYFVFGGCTFFLAFFYSTPLFKKNNNWYRLRDLPFAKLFLVGVVWSAVITIFPLIDFFNLFSKQEIYILFLIQFLFITSITIPFDIRDFAIDKHNKIKTLPINFGIKKSKQTAYAFVLIGLLFSVLFFFENSSFWITELIISVLCILLIKKSLPTSNDFFFTFYVDGLMILKPILFFVLLYIKNNF